MKDEGIVNMPVYADLAIVNAKVVTVDWQFSIAQAVSCKNGLILAVGSDQEIKQTIGPSTTVLDLKKNTVLPGINDSHMHGAYSGAIMPPVSMSLRSPEIRSIKDIVMALEKTALSKDRGQWIRGFGWNHSDLEECRNDKTRLPRKYDIDAVSPHHPVVMIEFSGHTLLANSKAMELAGVTKKTPDPEGGCIERDPNTGEPTGIFFEGPALELILSVVPDFTKNELKRSIISTLKKLNRYGITSFTDAALGPGGNHYFGGVMGEKCIEIYAELLEEGKLTVRTNILLLMGDKKVSSADAVQQTLKTFIPPNVKNKNKLRIAGAKIFADGLVRSKTAFMYNEYKGGGKGLLVLPGKNENEQIENLRRIIGIYHEAGLQIGVHVLGDRGVEETVDCFISAMEKTPGKHLRHYIIHGFLLNDTSIKKMVEHDIGLSVQPEIKSISTDLLCSLVEEEIAGRAMPIQTCLNAGIPVTCSSDAPITEPDWRKGMQSAILRKSKHTGYVSGSRERIGIEDAIRMYTINGARQDHMEEKKGSIEVGKFADLCILGEDILTTSPENIPDIPVLMTIVEGEVVFD
jgi:predicted amidohydrolase YtcJ